LSRVDGFVDPGVVITKRNLEAGRIRIDFRILARDFGRVIQ
jgi:hypothetical protein